MPLPFQRCYSQDLVSAQICKNSAPTLSRSVLVRLVHAIVGGAKQLSDYEEELPSEANFVPAKVRKFWAELQLDVIEIDRKYHMDY